jgi:hypothetical protein
MIFQELRDSMGILALSQGPEPDQLSFNVDSLP